MAAGLTVSLAALATLLGAGAAAAAPPAPIILSPHGGLLPVTEFAVDVYFVGDQSAAGFRCAAVRSTGSDQEPDISAAVPCTSPWHGGGLSTGGSNIWIWAVDEQGNPGPPAERFVALGAVPEALITGRPADRSVTDRSRVKLSFAASYLGEIHKSTLLCQLDGDQVPGMNQASTHGLLIEGFSLCNGTASMRVADGHHTLVAWGRRAAFGSTAGEYSGPPAFRTWTTDTHAPDTAIGAIWDKRGAARITFAGHDPAPGTTLRYRCRFGSGHWSDCESPLRKDLAPGRHRFAVRAVDAAENRDGSPARRVVDVGP
jgi:hypothetical protein